jgi:hypothetical protein
MIFPPFVYVTWQQLIARARAYKRGSRFVPEVAKCLGPQAEGITGDGSMLALYSRPWVLILEKSGILKLGRYNGANWIQVTPLSALPALPRDGDARHISMSFDQAARPVIAWEENQKVFIRQYDGSSGQYVTRGPFAGVDPILWADAQVLQSSTDSDVIVFCLNPDRDAIKYRLQRDQFSIESNLLAVIPNSRFEAVVTETYRYKLILSEPTNTLLMLVSSSYPAKEFNFNKMNLSAGLTAGAEFTNVLSPFGLEQMNLSAGLTAGNDFLLILDNPLLEKLNFSAGLTAGAEFTDSLSPLVLEQMILSAGLTAGAEFLAIISTNFIEGLNLVGGITEGVEV